ncbi:hypothetical protein [Niastella sp. OAS944]|uniref:hypothetical protein n=1 Tax=Niastella sp. OAS944 TaxID=2664089 RepID=UPI00346EACA9|nr:hypothetical protein [Chitinophagaceae bacterium OAS944]
MRQPFFHFVMVVTLLAGCGQREDVDRLKIINQSLEEANTVIQNENEVLGKALTVRARTPRTLYYGKIWEPRGNRIRREADSIVTMIENLKSDLLKQKEDPSFDKMMQRLAAFKDSIPFIFKGDSSLEFAYIQNDILAMHAKAPLLYGYSDCLNKDQRIQFIKNWREKNFSGASSVMAILVLNKIEHDVLATAKLFLDFCFSKTEVHTCGFRGIALMNSNYVKQGQSIEVTAGIGDFDTAEAPRISIAGKEIALNNEGAAVHRFAAVGKPGNNKIRVEFEFMKPDGSNEHVYKDLNYIIADEK